MVDLENNNLNISLLAEENISSSLISENLQVIFDTSTNISVKPALSYIKSGQKEISDYVSNVAEPRLSEYAQTAENQMQNSVNAVQKFADDIVDKGFVKTVDFQNALEGKQDVISDLPAIRNGATLGATAVQPADLASVATSGSYNDLSNKPDLNGKADVDLSNINTAGKSFVSGLGMPSSRHIDLTIGASGTSYTAPANGWFYLNVIMNGSNTFVLFSNSTSSYMKAFQWCSSGKQETGIDLPVKKGDVVSLEYNTTISYESWTNGFRFIYAKGAENV